MMQETTDIENGYISTDDYKKFTKDIVSERMKREEFLKRTDIADLVKISDLIDLNEKVATLAIKAELKAEQESFDSSYFRSKSIFWR